MVNMLVLYDIPQRRSRQQFEALLREYGFVWLFPYARWSAAAMATHHRLKQRIRSRLRHASYRIVFIELNARKRTEAVWMTATTDRTP